MHQYTALCLSRHKHKPILLLNTSSPLPLGTTFPTVCPSNFHLGCPRIKGAVPHINSETHTWIFSKHLPSQAAHSLWSLLLYLGLHSPDRRSCSPLFPNLAHSSTTVCRRKELGTGSDRGLKYQSCHLLCDLTKLFILSLVSIPIQ